VTEEVVSVKSFEEEVNPILMMIDKKILEITNYNLKEMHDFPHRARENSVPFKVIYKREMHFESI
jgi:hypothetical protein